MFRLHCLVGRVLRRKAVLSLRHRHLLCLRLHGLLQIVSLLRRRLTGGELAREIGCLRLHADTRGLKGSVRTLTILRPRAEADSSDQLLLEFALEARLVRLVVVRGAVVVTHVIIYYSRELPTYLVYSLITPALRPSAYIIHQFVILGRSSNGRFTSQDCFLALRSPSGRCAPLMPQVLIFWVGHLSCSNRQRRLCLARSDVSRVGLMTLAINLGRPRFSDVFNQMVCFRESGNQNLLSQSRPRSNNF